jgi:hypothetical protein
MSRHLKASTQDSEEVMPVNASYNSPMKIADWSDCGAAAKTSDAEDAKPWIITEAGDVLVLGWIRADTGSRHLQR